MIKIIEFFDFNLYTGDDNWDGDGYSCCPSDWDWPTEMLKDVEAYQKNYKNRVTDEINAQILAAIK